MTLFIRSPLRISTQMVKETEPDLGTYFHFFSVTGKGHFNFLSCGHRLLHSSVDIGGLLVLLELKNKLLVCVVYLLFLCVND